MTTANNAINPSQCSTFHEHNQCVNIFLLPYCSSCHSPTHGSPSKHFKGKLLKPDLLCLKPGEVVFYLASHLSPSSGIKPKNLDR